MKIKSKFFLSCILVGIISALLATFSAIYSISKKYENIAIEEAISKTHASENFFYENLGNLTRKAAFISELSEIIDNIEKPEELSVYLENKSFFLNNINATILDPNFNTIISFNNSSSDSCINKNNTIKIPFFGKQRDPLIRDAGIFEINNKIYILVISPIVDQKSFDFKGYVFFELCLNSEFADQLKDKTNGDIVIISNREKLASTFQDTEGRRFFPKIPKISKDKIEKLNIFNKKFLIESFPIISYSGTNIGKVLVSVNINDITIAKKHGILNILLVLLVVVILVIFISLWLGNKLTKPILVLSDGAKSISKGKLDIKIKPTSKDEIGQLTKLFNKMAESIKNQREEILDLKIFFEKIIENSPYAIFICDESSKIITINSAAKKIFEVNQKEVENKELFTIIELPQSIKAEYFTVLLSGQPSFYDKYPLIMKNGEEKIVRLTFYNMKLKSKGMVAVQIEDISDQLRTEQELIHAQKLGTLGEMSSKFTHEFNNLITGIMGYVELIKNRVSKNSEIYNKIDAIGKISKKANELGKNILDFSKKETIKLEKINIGELIYSVLSLIENTILKNIEIEKRYSKKIQYYIYGNKTKLLLVLFNTLFNAKDSIQIAEREKGRIVISIERFTQEQNKIKFIRMQIFDNGTGIKPNIIKRIFEPYFTTKRKKGTGLGLSYVKQIVEENRGIISVKSKPEEGATFIFDFQEFEPI